MRAFVLIQAEVGRSIAVAEAVGSIPGVLYSAMVSGPYDVIAHLEGDSLDKLSTGVVVPIQRVEGVIHTITCPEIHL